MSLFDFYGQFFLKNMIELIKVETNSKEQQVVSAKELYDFLGYDKSQWARWYKKNIEDNDFAVQLVDYEPIDRMSSKENGNFAKDFAITIDFAKKLSMMAKTEKGEEARNYFLNCEKKLMNPKPLNPIELIIQSAQQLLMIQQEQEKQAERIAILEAKQISETSEFYTIAGYCALRGFKKTTQECNILGRKATKMSKELDYTIGSQYSAAYGRVNTYHLDILTQIIN